MSKVACDVAIHIVSKVACNVAVHQVSEEVNACSGRLSIWSGSVPRKKKPRYLCKSLNDTVTYIIPTNVADQFVRA